MGLIKASAILVVLHLGSVICQGEFDRPCNHEIFCDGPILHEVQMAEVFSDSKTFVDRPLRYSIAQVQRNFEEFMEYHNRTPSKEDLKIFVDYNFEEPGTEFVPWEPEDWHENPAFLEKIVDLEFRRFANDLHKFWHELGRQLRPDIEDNEVFQQKNSLIWVPYPVVVPGGRFREFYYWDSYWIQMGLIQSEMLETVEGMIRNFLYMVETIGFVPNGGRIYYRRSQPPLLIPMVKNYYNATLKLEFVREVLPTLVKEFSFWETQRAINVSYNEMTYKMYRYNSMKNAPRPESYMEDFKLAEAMLDDERKDELYSALHSGAESGIDFSSRWFVKNQRLRAADLIYLSTRSFIPVDLNGYMYYNAKTLAEFHTLVNDAEGAARYENIANDLLVAINEVLWVSINDTVGCWFDYNHITGTHHTAFYPTNIVPLWAEAQSSSDQVVHVLNYLTTSGALNYPGGIPASLEESGEQWDLPNAWAPLMDLIVVALERSGNAAALEKAFELVQTWVSTNYIAFYMSDPNHMYEKYNVTELGKPGGGGEYEIVIGFGWSNGVVLEYLSRYGEQLVAPPLPRTGVSTTEQSLTGPPATLEPTTPDSTGSATHATLYLSLIAMLLALLQLF